MQAEIIAIGSEMLTPFRVDTNSLYLTDQLERLGIPVIRKTVVGDKRGTPESGLCRSPPALRPGDWNRRAGPDRR